jgi:hypothetical protein
MRVQPFVVIEILDILKGEGKLPERKMKMKQDKEV